MKRLLLGTSMALLVVVPAAAHHGNAVYDTTRTVSVTGAVTKWQLINPHTGLWIEVRTPSGAVEVWSGEFGGVLDLYRAFKWNKETFKPGDRVTLTGNPARNGSTAMLVRKVTLAGGQEIDLEGT